MNRSAGNNILIDLINGNILTRDSVIGHLPYFFFLAFLGLVYIANGYLAEDAIRKINKKTNEIKELRSEYITTKSQLMYKSKQSEVAKILLKKNINIIEPTEPPKKIIISKNEKIAFEP